MKTEWISVKDRLPENKGRYLTYNNLEYPYVWQAVYRYTEKGFLNNELDSVISVTHWMPLPEPPQEARP